MSNKFKVGDKVIVVDGFEREADEWGVSIYKKLIGEVCTIVYSTKGDTIPYKLDKSEGIWLCECMLKAYVECDIELYREVE